MVNERLVTTTCGLVKYTDVLVPSVTLKLEEARSKVVGEVVAVYVLSVRLEDAVLAVGEETVWAFLIA